MQHILCKAQQGLLSLLVRNSVFYPCWCAIGPSFPVGMQEDHLSLLVLHMMFFPAGDSPGLLSLLVLSNLTTLKFYHGNQTKQAVSEKKCKNEMAAVVTILDFLSHSLSCFGSRTEVILLLQCVSTQNAQWLGRSKTGFQDGGYFGFLFGMILAFHIRQPVSIL